MNGLALIFPVVATRKLSCASLRLATIASATPTPMTVATTRHESASTSRLEDHPLTPKVAQDPLSGGTRPPLQTRLPEAILERAGLRQPLRRFNVLTLSSSTS